MNKSTQTLVGLSREDELFKLLDDRLVEFLLASLGGLEGDRATGICEAVEVHVGEGESDESLRERFCNTFGQHEAMDRSFILAENVESYLRKHPYILLNPRAYLLATLATLTLHELYQECGKEEFPEKT